VRKIRKVQRVKVTVDGKKMKMKARDAWNLALKEPDRIQFALDLTERGGDTKCGQV
jgi:hypothetical protein